MTAIVTKYLGPTASRKGRVKATCAVGSVTVSFDHAFNIKENHEYTARALAARYGWPLDMVYGSLPDNSGFAFIANDAAIRGIK